MWAGNQARIPDSYIYTVTNTRCRKGTVIFSWWWTHSCPKHVEKSNKHIKKICAPSWFYSQETANYTSNWKQHINITLRYISNPDTKDLSIFPWNSTWKWR